MEMVTWLIVGSTAYVLLGTLFQSIFYNLYNASYHPFAKILDLSEGSEGKLFKKYMCLICGFNNSNQHHNNIKHVKWIFFIFSYFG